jgi:tetratricopeptide (TPR) repeat protein
MTTPDDAPRPNFVDWSALSGLPSLGELQSALDDADWADFVAPRDLSELRTRLDHLAKTDGVGELHRRCTEKLRELGAELRHRVIHTEPHVAFGLSADRRYLATGSWVGADYDSGGALQIWEVATGCSVNALQGVDGGVGWPGYPDCIQWSPSGDKVGAAFATNSIGDFDAFGESSEPGTWVATTNGWSRPPAWCWRPDGDAVAVGCWGDSPVPGCIAPMQASQLDSDQVYEQSARWFADEISDDLADEDGNVPDLQPQVWLRFSQDGKRLYGHNKHNQAYAVDVASGELQWVSQVGDNVAWSPDDALFAHDMTGLIFYDADTGLPTTKLPMHMGGSQLAWSPDAEARLLAMVVEPGNPFGADPAVHLYEDGEFVGTIEVEPGAPGDTWDFHDARLWAWAPDGVRGACLTADSTVEVWQVGATPEPIRTIEVSSKTAGILWGADDTLICVGKEMLEFRSIDDDSLQVRYDHAAALAAYGELHGQVPRPLDVGHGIDLAARWRISPSFALGEGDQADWVFVDRDFVVCPDALQGSLDDELCWVLDNRYAWPLSWGEASTFDTIAEALDEGVTRFDDDDEELLLEAAKLRTEGGGRKTDLDLGSAATLDDLFEVHADSLRDLGRGWSSHKNNDLRETALMQAGRGELDAAFDAASEVVDTHQAIATYADLAVALVRHGALERAAQALQLAELDAEEPVDDWATTAVYAPLAAANHLLGREECARDMFEKAREHIDNEANPFQRYLALARGYMAIGDFDAADAAIADGPWDGRWLSMFLRAYIIELAEYGQVDQVEAALDRCVAAGMDVSDFELADGIVDAFIDHEEFEAAWQILERFERLSVTHYRERIVDAMIDAGLEDEAREKGETFERSEQILEVPEHGDELKKTIARAKIAARAGDVDTRDELFEEARTLALDGSRDKRFALGDVQTAQVAVGDLAGAYQTLRKQTPTNRVYEMSSLLDACAKAGEYGAVIQLLEQLPSETMNDRPQKAMRALRLAVYGHNRRPQW